MGNTFYFQWEADLMIWLQAHLGPVGEKLAYYVSAFGEELFIILMRMCLQKFLKGISQTLTRKKMQKLKM